MQLNPISSGVLVGFFIFISLALFVILCAMAFLLLKMNSLLEEYRARLDPLLEKADTVLSLTTDKVTTIGGKAEVILSQAEEVAGTVHEKVDRTTTAVQRTIHAPLIGINSLAAGLTHGIAAFSRLQQREPLRDINVNNSNISAPQQSATVQGAGEGTADSISQQNTQVPTALPARVGKEM